VQNKSGNRKKFLQKIKSDVTFASLVVGSSLVVREKRLAHGKPVEGSLTILECQHPQFTLVPMIEIQPSADKPLPFDMSDEQPKTHKDGIAIAVNTSNLIDKLGPGLDYEDKDLHKTAELFNGTDKPATPKHISVPAEAKAASVLIKTFDFQAFADIQQARTFITNKLVKMTDCGDPKIEIKALELLGKHSDIGLFTERSEITVHHTTSKGLEDSIKERIKRLMNADVTDVTPLDDLDTLLGPAEDTREDVPNEQPES
jgi:hypothetical protein